MVWFLPGAFFWSAISLACVMWVGSVGGVVRVGGVVWAVRAGIHLKMYQMTCQLSESATAWSQTKIKVKWRKCDWVTFLPHDFTWQFLHHLQISSRQLSENDFLIHLSTSIRFLQKLKQWALNRFLRQVCINIVKTMKVSRPIGIMMTTLRRLMTKPRYEIILTLL